MTSVAPRPTDLAERCDVANDLWLSFCSGLTLSCLRSHGQDAIGELEFRSLRRHQLVHFRRGLAKLELDGAESDAIRCARYHYFSNSLGGRRMEYVEESDSKVWIRYRPPYWICDGTGAPMGSVAALGPEIGRAAFRAWHANNGPLLGNDRLAFVQTQSQCDGDPWEAGYFIEHDTPIPDSQRYRRRPGEWGPAFDPATAPALPHLTWPPERRARALRNFAIGHTTSRLVSLTEMYGIVGAAAITEHAFRTVLTARWRWLPERLGIDPVTSPHDAARFFAMTAALVDDEVEVGDDGDAATVTRRSNAIWRGAPRLAALDAAIARAWDATLRLHAWDLRCSMTLDGDVEHWRFVAR